uniref:Epidermal growth factor receptor kinase substrate 8 n=2 Tax=Cacopsylla melanoneura TaxID=428564 RepID=A0A8D8W688_9HEMI
MAFSRSSVTSNNSYEKRDSGDKNDEEGPVYVMEHLATFTVAKETGIVYPADGMRRLLQLEKSNGIWSQKMQLKLDKNVVQIMDYETGAVMERFPFGLIQDPTAFTSHDPMEMYNNILVFIVGEEHQNNSRSEMHIFQCQSISAQDLVESLKLLRAGKSIPSNRKSRPIPPPPPTPPPDPPLNGVNVREKVSAFNASTHRDHPDSVRGGGENMSDISGGGVGGYSLYAQDDETCSNTSEKYERDVTILNHCFDDIEKFIARLQHAAAASRELERRHRNRKSKKKDLGDGMLTMRAKPPPEIEFIEIFQKFKLSFNLLAKLKAHIHDPNAPELIHFLFTPLALIVDASHDTEYGPNLPAKVVSPLLTRDAINLLINCVTSKETELWHSLGDAWLVARDQWKGYVVPYHPIFMDGWSPEYPINDELESVGMMNSSPAEGKKSRDELRATPLDPELRDPHHHHYPPHHRTQDSHYGSEYFDYEGGDRQPSPAGDPRYSVDALRHEVYSREDSHPSERGPDYPSHSDRHPHPPGGEYNDRHPSHQHLGDTSARSDISADSIERNGGPGGSGIMSEKFERAQARWLEELRLSGAKIVQVTYPRTANNDKELTVVRSELLEVLDDSRKWWKARNSRGQVAHVPHTIVTVFNPDEPSEVFNNPLYSREYSGQNDREPMGVNRSSGVSPTSAPAEWVRKERLGKKGEFRYF